MSDHGATWVCQQPKSMKASKLNIMTVCNTGNLATSVSLVPFSSCCVVYTKIQGYGTALGLITRLHELSKLENAFYSQSTPYHQGSRLTALELQSLNIPSTMICDSMVGSLFQHYEIHAVGKCGGLAMKRIRHWYLLTSRRCWQNCEKWWHCQQGTLTIIIS